MKKGFSKMFGWLFIGLLITFGIGYLVSMYPIALGKVFTGKSYIIVVVLELAIAIFFSVRLAKMSDITAKICYILYSVITGFTFGLIFLVYDLMSIMSVFLATSLVFGIFALIGYKTKRDLSKMSMWLFMSLLAVIIVSIVNIFLKSSGLEFAISILFILIFLGYVVFDMKNAEMLIDTVGEEKGAVYGAFQLYLDFINLFIRLLQIMGKLKDE
ncbi:MAG: Bax inhibitor-1/YccA family protein [Bacilli bacterium]|nr:Bax inhibitor-1/YccA family protein [Bacilli bacterium]